MAWTASAIPEQEFCEPLHDLDSKAEKLAEKIRQSKHFIAFTGAGISTSAGA
jgi:mono-ADP-ribosyltransferase sirtuin 6